MKETRIESKKRKYETYARVSMAAEASAGDN